jgi:NADH-quinone oxidoreductase subunit M
MSIWQIPWLELAFLVALLGGICVSQMRDAYRAAGAGLFFAGTVLVLSILASASFYLGYAAEAGAMTFQTRLLGRNVFGLDHLSAPLVPAVALLHFLTSLATARTKMRRFSFAWSLVAEAVRLATFSCNEPTALIALLVIGVLPPYVELSNREKPTRVYVLHMSLFVALLLIGWGLLSAGERPSQWAAIPFALAALVRSGVVPVHCWVTDWFEHATYGNALLFVAPLTGIYATVRLVLPIAPEWVLQAIEAIALFTAFYAAGMALVQQETRRFYAYLFLSHASLVLVGVVLHTPISVSGALCLWFSVILSLGGFGLTIRAMEARFGRLTLAEHHGLYDHVPSLAVCFLMTGLASVGFPGTLGFVSTELLVDGAVDANLYVGLIVIAVAALNGSAVLRAYFLLFTGKRHVSSVSLSTTPWERIAVLTLAALILLGGLFPQPGVATQYLAAESILKDRKNTVEEAKGL